MTHTNVTKLEELRRATSRVDADDERSLRVQLAAAYRIFDYLGWPQLIFGHITVRLPGPERHVLINPFGLLYHEVTASNLVKIDLDGNIVGAGDYPVNPAGFVIHSAIHAAREDVRCVMHTHTRAGMAVAALRDGLNCSDFAGISLHNKVAYHDFEGLTVRMDERERLVASLGEKNLMVLRNHGLLTCGSTVAEAFLRMYTLQTACEVQVTARATGAPLVEPPPEVRARHAASLESGEQSERVFAALIRLMDARDPGYRN